LAHQTQQLRRRFTEADLRLYPTIVRFDAAYATLFKCCRRRIADYPNLSAWLRDVYQLDMGAASPVQARGPSPKAHWQAKGCMQMHAVANKQWLRPCAALSCIRIQPA